MLDIGESCNSRVVRFLVLSKLARLNGFSGENKQTNKKTNKQTKKQTKTSQVNEVAEKQWYGSVAHVPVVFARLQSVQ
jgi:hypothetical protein